MKMGSKHRRDKVTLPSHMSDVNLAFHAHYFLSLDSASFIGMNFIPLPLPVFLISACSIFSLFSCHFSICFDFKQPQQYLEIEFYNIQHFYEKNQNIRLIQNLCIARFILV